MRWMGTLTKFWAWLSTSLTVLLIVFLFGYVFEHGAGNISVEFLTQSPRGMVLGSEGGIWPAIVGSHVLHRCRCGDGKHPGGGSGFVSGVLL